MEAVRNHALRVEQIGDSITKPIFNLLIPLLNQDNTAILSLPRKTKKKKVKKKRNISEEIYYKPESIFNTE